MCVREREILSREEREKEKTKRERKNKKTVGTVLENVRPLLSH